MGANRDEKNHSGVVESACDSEPLCAAVSRIDRDLCIGGRRPRCAGRGGAGGQSESRGAARPHLRARRARRRRRHLVGSGGRDRVLECAGGLLLAPRSPHERPAAPGAADHSTLGVERTARGGGGVAHAGQRARPGGGEVPASPRGLRAVLEAHPLADAGGGDARARRADGGAAGGGPGSLRDGRGGPAPAPAARGAARPAARRSRGLRPGGQRAQRRALPGALPRRGEVVRHAARPGAEARQRNRLRVAGPAPARRDPSSSASRSRSAPRRRRRSWRGSTAAPTSPSG